MTLKKNQDYTVLQKNRQIGVEEVYNIVKTHDINVLNTNIIKLMESK